MSGLFRQLGSMLGVSFAAVCCLEVSWALAALGAGFLINDAILIPIYLAFIALSLWLLWRALRPRGELRPLYLSAAGALVAALTCPCHAPILVFALSGTSAGVLLADYTVAALALMTIAFVLSLRAALRAFDRPDKLGESR